MKIIQKEIARSFSAKIQLRQFEPIDVFASRKVVVEDATDEEITELGNKLYNDCLNDVYTEIVERKDYQKILEPQKQARKMTKAKIDIPF